MSQRKLKEDFVRSDTVDVSTARMSRKRKLRGEVVRLGVGDMVSKEYMTSQGLQVRWVMAEELTPRKKAKQSPQKPTLTVTHWHRDVQDFQLVDD